MRIIDVLDKKGREIVGIVPQSTLHEAAKRMAEAGTGALFVFEGDRPIGIVTERDVLKALGEHGAAVTEVSVASVMSRRLVTCPGEVELQEAMALMLENPTSQRIRHLPVVDGDGTICGMISMSDLVHALLDEISYENKMLKFFIKNWSDEGEDKAERR